jgi:hypothetical protein
MKLCSTSARIASALRQVRRGRDPATRVPAGRARNRLVALEAAGMTRAEVARRAGVSPSSVNRVASSTTAQFIRDEHDALSNPTTLFANFDEMAASPSYVQPELPWPTAESQLPTTE